MKPDSNLKNKNSARCTVVIPEVYPDTLRWFAKPLGPDHARLLGRGQVESAWIREEIYNFALLGRCRASEMGGECGCNARRCMTELSDMEVLGPTLTD